MRRSTFARCVSGHHKIPLKLLLTFLGGIGLLFGFVVGKRTPVGIISLMRPTIYKEASFLLLVGINFIPFFILSFLIHYRRYLLILPFIFFRLYSLGFCLCCTSILFNSAGWLVGILYFFGNYCADFIFLSIAFKFIQSNDRFTLRVFIITCLILLFITIIQDCLFSPFLVNLLNY